MQGAGHDSSAKAKVAAAMGAIEAAETEGGRPPKERAGSLSDATVKIIR